MSLRARSRHVVTEQVGDELVAFDSVEMRAHRLNETAAAVWQSCDGHRDDEAIAIEVERILGRPCPGGVVASTLTMLNDARLLEKPRPLAAPMTRRNALRTVAAAGGLVVAAPVVESILLPTPAMAQTAPAVPPTPTTTGPGAVPGGIAFALGGGAADDDFFDDEERALDALDGDRAGRGRDRDRDRDEAVRAAQAPAAPAAPGPAAPGAGAPGSAGAGASGRPQTPGLARTD